MGKPKKDTRILLLEGIHPNAKEKFLEAGFSKIETLSGSLSSEELTKKIVEVDILGIRSRTQVSKAVLETAPHLLSIGCFCIGTNQVDLIKSTQKGVSVFNAPYSNTRSVAELTLGAIIMLLRDIPRKNFLCHQGEWAKSAKNAFEVRKKKLGIVGYGNIGAQLGLLAGALGMEVSYYDINPKLSYGNIQRSKRLDQLLSSVDIVSLHVPSVPGTRNLLSRKRLELMKEGAYIINYARGDLVDIEALCVALDSGKIRGAALDVFPVEPKQKSDEFISPLRKYPQVLLSPHIGGSTEEAQAEIAGEVSEKLCRFLREGDTLGSVNFPEISMGQVTGCRLSHIHENKPGMLSQINYLLSKKNINVLGQNLKTKEEMGYVIFDIDASEIVDEVVHELRQIPGTLRCDFLCQNE